MGHGQVLDSMMAVSLILMTVYGRRLQQNH